MNTSGPENRTPHFLDRNKYYQPIDPEKDSNETIRFKQGLQVLDNFMEQLPLSEYGKQNQVRYTVEALLNAIDSSDKIGDTRYAAIEEIQAWLEKKNDGN